MNLLVLILCLAVLALAMAALLAAIAFANRLPATVRVVAACGLLPLELLCIYGFLAAAEPGPGHPWWQLGYGLGFLVLAVAQSRLLLTKTRETV